MIDEFPRQFEASGQCGRQCFHPESFGRIMYAVEEIDAEFFGDRVAPMWPFAGDERVDSLGAGLRHFAARAAGHHPDLMRARGAALTKMRRRSEHPRKPNREFFPMHPRDGAQTERLSL